jgi:hypothetical protein
MLAADSHLLAVGNDLYKQEQAIAKKAVMLVLSFIGFLESYLFGVALMSQGERLPRDR